MGAGQKGARKRRTVQIEQSLNRNIRDVEIQQVQAGQRSFGAASFCPADIVLPKGYGKIIKIRNVEQAAHSGKVKSTSCQYPGMVTGTTHLLFSSRRPCIRPVCCGEATSLFNPSLQRTCMMSSVKTRRRSATNECVIGQRSSRYAQSCMGFKASGNWIDSKRCLFETPNE